MAETLTMIPVFLLNLERQPTRLAIMRAQFEALGIPFERADAVDGSRLSGSSGTSVASFANLSPGEIGCFESHLKIWRQVVERDLPHAVVIEDDMVLASDFGRLLRARPPEGCDLVKLDQTCPSVLTASDGPELTEGRRAVRLFDTDYATGAYIVSRQGAETLIAESRSYFLPVDRVMFDRHSPGFVKRSNYKIIPPAAIQFRHFVDNKNQDVDGDFLSGIQRGRERDRWFSWSNMRIRMRRLQDWDIMPVRRKRYADFIEKAQRVSAGVERGEVFSSPDLAHLPADIGGH